MKYIDEILKKFGVKNYRIIPRDGYFIIVTSNEGYCLKKTNLSHEELIFVHGAKEYIWGNGFIYFDRYCLTNSNPYVVYNNEHYIMEPYIQGRKLDRYKLLDIKSTMEMLAKFHIAAKGYQSKVKIKSNIDIENSQKQILKKWDDFTYIYNIISMKSKKDRLDKLFLDKLDKFKDIGFDAIQRLQKCNYSLQINSALDEKQLFHGNLKYSNIIIDRNYDCYLISLEDCKYGLKLLDIINLISQTMNLNYWNFDLCKSMINSYSEISNLSKLELMIIGALLQFPQKFWKLSTMYYYEKYPWADKLYYYSLRDVVEKLPYKISFLEKYYSDLI